MPTNCTDCGSVMKPLFYMTSLFCPNDCDRKPRGWIESGHYWYQILPPGVSYPVDATILILLGENEARAKEFIGELLKNLINHPILKYNVNYDERRWRDNPKQYQYKQWVLVTKVR